MTQVDVRKGDCVRPGYAVRSDGFGSQPHLVRQRTARLNQVKTTVTSSNPAGDWMPAQRVVRMRSHASRARAPCMRHASVLRCTEQDQSHPRAGHQLAVNSIGNEAVGC